MSILAGTRSVSTVRVVSLSVAALATTTSAACPGSGPFRYRVVWIDRPDGPGHEGIYPYALSSDGAVVGHFNSAPDYWVPRGFTYDGVNLLRLMGGPNCSPNGNSFGFAVNRGGDIAGMAAESCHGGGHAILSSLANPEALVYLPNLQGLSGDSCALALSDDGVVVGMGSLPSESGPGFSYSQPANPCRWVGGQIELLPVLPGSYAGAAMDINSHHDIAGFFLLPHDPQRFDDARAFVLPAGATAPVQLPGFGGPRSRAFRLLDNGDAYGFAERADGTLRAVRWPAGGPPIDLGSIAGMAHSVALGADTRGLRAVGGVSTGEPATGIEKVRIYTEMAVLFENGQVTPLASLVAPEDGLYFNNAYAINDAGWIVGQGGTLVGGVNRTRAFLLIPNCIADFNCDDFVDFFDYLEFVSAFESGAATADVNGDGFLDFFDYDAFVSAFEAGC